MSLTDNTKEELIEALSGYHDKEAFRCIHGHNGLSHKNCYEKERGLVNRIGIFDIETFELLGDWGFGFSYCIKVLGSDKIYKALALGKDVTNHKVRDKFLIKQFCKDVKNFDTLVVYYGKDTGGRYQRHDIPFFRTRAERWGFRFPKDGELSIIDMYDVVKSKFKFKRNSLEHACRFFRIPAKGTPHNWDVWQRARDGHDGSLRKILKHNVEDVVATEILFKKIYNYKRVRTKI